MVKQKTAGHIPKISVNQMHSHHVAHVAEQSPTKYFEIMVVCIKWRFFPRRNIVICRISTSTKTWLHVKYIFQKNHLNGKTKQIYVKQWEDSNTKRKLLYLSSSSCLVKSLIRPRFHLKHLSAPTGSLSSCGVVLDQAIQGRLKRRRQTTIISMLAKTEFPAFGSGLPSSESDLLHSSAEGKYLIDLTVFHSLSVTLFEESTLILDPSKFSWL